MAMQVVTAHGAKIPQIGFGTWPMKGEECVRAVEAALAAGYRHIDTAAGYQNEREVGEALRASGVKREEIFITTKIRPWDLAEGDMQRAAEASLKQLGVDQVDLILIHWPSRTLSVTETTRSLNGVKRRGFARNIGVSNYPIRLLDEAWAATEEPLAVNQCEYHPYLNQDKLIAACRARDMAFTAYSPLGQRRELDDPAIERIAKMLGRTSAQVVLRWLLQQGVVAIPKSATPERIRENFDVFGFSLSPEDMHTISALARPGSRLVKDPDLAPVWDN
jgi:diketogulonate reductase-like aldo/keto reductase